MFQFPEKMLEVFKNPGHQTLFEKNGYIILPFYSEEEISVLQNTYKALHPKDEEGFFPSTFSKDIEYRHKADEMIRKVGVRSIEYYCKDIKIVCGSFIAKSPGKDSGMCVHQDMSLVDESVYTGINIWCPLIDLSIQNGTLFLLPGSHRIFPTYRGSSIPEFFSGVMEDMIDYLVPIEIKAGEAVFFDQSIIHFSPPNYSKVTRVVTNIYIAHKDTKYRTYYWNKELHQDKIEVFEQADDFMTNFTQFGENIRDRPKVGKSLGFVDYNFPMIDKSFLEKRFNKTNSRELIESVVETQYQHYPPENNTNGIFDRIKKIFQNA